MEKFLAFFGILLLGMGTGTPAFPERLHIAIDDYPPFEYEEHGVAKGIGTQVVEAVLKEADLQADFTLYPFARAYSMVTQGEEPVLYYSLVRTPQREALVQWVGVVAPAEQVLLGLKGRHFQISSPDDLKKYSIGTVLEDIVDQHLRSREAALGLHLDRAASYENNIKKLMRGRFDTWGGNRLVGLYLLERLGHRRSEVQVVYEFKELQGEYYLVANKTVPGAIVRQLQAAFAKIHADGTYQKIIREYLEDPE